MTELKKRLKKIDNLKEKLDAIIVINEENNSDYFYFTGTKAQGTFFYDFNKAKIITNPMELGRAKKSWVRNVETKRFDEILKENRGSKIGINFSKTTHETFMKLNKKLRLLDAGKNIDDARSIKTKYEEKCIRAACNISKKCLLDTKLTGSELEIAAEIEKKMKIINCGKAFDTIVASGKNIKVPHHEPTRTKARKPLLIDFGAKYKGYCSDVSRTFGSRLENIVLKTIESTEKEIFPGAKASEVDAIARKTLGKYEKYFITSLGHGIGIDVHERPWISKNSKDIFEEGMVFTIEPGIYVEGGIRIENDYLITRNGFKKLTDF